MSRVIVTRHMVGICHMQVCAVADATDQEILEVCNRENPSGTSRGWCSVIRNSEDNPKAHPIKCQDDGERTHFLVAC